MEKILKGSEFRQDGDYLIGGLFDVHLSSKSPNHQRPEAFTCSNQPFILTSYRRLQIMRFSVEQINNSTDLLPNVSLGYEIFDHCSDTQNFPSILKLISVNNIIQPWGESSRNISKVIAVVGTYTSTEAITVAPFFMTNLIPMVSYGAASSALSKKKSYPSFLRTVHPNTDILEVFFKILQEFNWHWVSFLYTDDDYGTDALNLFSNIIKETDICLAYTKSLEENTDYPLMFRQLESRGVNVIIAFVLEWTAEDLIKGAIKHNFTNKVWIAGDGWSLNKRIHMEKGIRNIGTVVGVAEPAVPIPGFRDFIYSSKGHCSNGNPDQGRLCNQISNCNNLTAEDIINADPSFSFSVYSAIYAIAHALHNTLQCGDGSCNRTIPVKPHMVLAAMRKSDFKLLNQRIRFNENGDPNFGSYSIFYWNRNGEAEEIGSYHFDSFFHINTTKIQWHGNGEVPTSFCSKACPVGFSKKQEGIYKCCFICTICPTGTYINTTEDPYNCISCKETEWSYPGSTTCNLRQVEYVTFFDSGSIVIMFGACILVALTVAISALFSINFATPVVRSAGGPMCFLILGCLTLSSLSVFFYFGKPTVASCVLRFFPFLLFYTVCLACFVVRSFQIVCIFKIAAKFPKLLSWWRTYNGQWLVISLAFVIQTVLLIIVYSVSTPKPYSDRLLYLDKLILGCDYKLKVMCGPVIFISLLCCLCFIFSYMGKDLPKNYNEAKAITFCLLLLILTWIIFATASILYHGKHISTFNALAVLSSLYSFLLWYFVPKCYIIIFYPNKNTQQHFQGLIQNYTKAISQ
ncbi:PREDICTED: taste receptor type 1 member 1-like [Cyprinodon variegatus]|uniref:taste receptor type 1 member 1-like n=1 Tax=Cyprinodon variegatus TaxID=28743 RepID=UPI000742B4CA|nr:PREDICTED: taste receptor type 1 member 1-like [Cyprinodon variegatus]